MTLVNVGFAMLLVPLITAFLWYPVNAIIHHDTKHLVEWVLMAYLLVACVLIVIGIEQR